MTEQLVPWKGSALAALVEQSGLSVVRFARLILSARADRTVRRWQKDGIPIEVETWAREDVVRVERRGHQLQLSIQAPIDPRRDRTSPAGASADED